MHYQHELFEEFPITQTPSLTSHPIPAFCCPLCSLLHTNTKTNNRAPDLCDQEKLSHKLTFCLAVAFYRSNNTNNLAKYKNVTKLSFF